MKKKRQKFSGAEKVRILRRHLIDKESVSDICDEYGIQLTMLYNWQKVFFENGAFAFERKKDTKSRRLEAKISQLEPIRWFYLVLLRAK